MIIPCSDAAISSTRTSKWPLVWLWLYLVTQLMRDGENVRRPAGMVRQKAEQKIVVLPTFRIKCDGRSKLLL